MVISARIKTIGDLIDENDVVADIGADHGLLELYLISKYQDISITAIENKFGPFKKLDSKLRAFKNVRLSFSDGLTAVDKGISCVIIAGMGGYNIKDILLARPEKLEKVKKIIIDAHRYISVARKTIVDLGYKIKQEKIVYEAGKFYIIIEFIKTREKVKYNADELEIGYELYKDDLWKNYRHFLIKKNNYEINKIKNVKRAQDKVLKLKTMNERLSNYGKNEAI